MITGPKRVNSGLVFGFDADNNSRFYNGEPTENLITYSEDFNQWYKGGTYTITPNSITSPIGDNTGTLLYTNTASNISKSIPCTIGTPYTLSWYAKKYDSSIIGSETNVGASYNFGFNFDTHVFTGNGLNKTYEDFGNGWYRLSYTIITTTNTTFNFYLYGGSGYGASGTSYIWGAQVELKPHKTDYIKTTSTLSNTNSTNLLDIKDTTTIDISNVSFNYNGVPYFYGNGYNKIKCSTTLGNKVNGNELTVECWMKPTILAGRYQDIIVNRGDGSNYNWMLYQHSTDGAISFHGVNQYKSSYIPTLNKWVHIVVTVSSLNICTIYANGVQVYQGTYYYNLTTPSLICIGAFGDSTTVEPYAGCITNVRIYNNTLSAKEVYQNYNSTKGRFMIENHLNNGLVFHLEGSNKNSLANGGTTWYDLSPNNIPITFEGGPTYRYDNDGSLLFDATDDSLYLNLTNKMNDFTTTELTLSTFAMQTASSTSDGFLFDLDLVGYRLWGGSTTAFMARGPNSTLQPWQSVGWSYNLNQWYMLTATMIDDGTTNNVKIYVNGVLYSQSTFGKKGFAPNGVASARMSCHYGGRNKKPFKIGSFRKYTRVLSETEILNLFNLEKDRYGL